MNDQLTNLINLSKSTGKVEGLRSCLTVMRMCNSLDEAQIAVADLLNAAMREGEARISLDVIRVPGKEVRPGVYQGEVTADQMDADHVAIEIVPDATVEIPMDPRRAPAAEPGELGNSLDYDYDWMGPVNC